MPKPTFFHLHYVKRQQIIDAAISEFAEIRYQDVNINHLIERMDIATGSFYQYFTDKKDVYFYVLSIYLELTTQKAKDHSVTFNLTDAEESKKGALAHPELELDERGNIIFNVKFNEAPNNIIRDWVFEKLVGGEHLDLYDYSIFDRPEVPQMYRDNREIIMSMYIAIRAVVERFATFTDDYDRYWELYRMFMTILNDGITKGSLQSHDNEQI